ncbi:MAG TPA: hypothetical protein VGR00_04735 [Thermoanaerobaculia bacterium]|nr:hypothetical protein [Thermoanaerobaculia bacterium]
MTTKGAEFHVNTYTTNQQTVPRVARAPNGDFVIVWQSNVGTGYTPDYEVFARRYGSSGAALGGAFRVNTYTTSVQKSPAVAIAGTGDFIVVWVGSGPGGANSGAFFQRYASAGTPLGGEFRINAHSMNIQADPSVGADPSGNFVVAWADGYDNFRAHARRFSSAGGFLGAEFTVPTTVATTLSFFRSAVGVGQTGDFVIVWDQSDTSNPGIGYDVFLRRFTSAGVSLTSDMQVNTYTSGKQNRPQIAMDGSADFVIVWRDGYPNGHITGKRYNNIGNPLGGDFRVNSQTTAYPRDNPSVASDSAGNFVVVWQSLGYPGDGSLNIIGRLFNANGSPRGSEFRVNDYSNNAQRSPWVAMDTSGNFVAAWEDQDQEGAGVAGIFARRFCPNLVGVTINLTSGSTNICPGQAGGTLVVTDDGGGTVGHQWGYRTMSGGTVTDLGGQTGPSYVLNTGNALPGGLSYVVCTSVPGCGSITVSNEIAVFKGDVTAPSVSAPPGATAQQTLCQ